MNLRRPIPKYVLIFSNMLFIGNTTATPTVEIAQSPLDLSQFGVAQSVPDVAVSNANGTELNIFQAGFSSVNWSGYLKKYRTTFDLGDNTNITNQPLWEAGEILTHVMVPANRKIYTYDATTKATIPFTFSNLPVTTQAMFNLAESQSSSDNLGAMRVDYLYGDRQLESNIKKNQSAAFRKRDTILGDVVNSAPVYVGGAESNVIGNNYTTFYTEYKNRAGAVYIGANDGMLHAFSANTGVELFAYVPSPLLNKLPELTYPTYTHDSFVDGKITVKAAQVSGSWKTVLASGMGGGAKGVFALDVTKPDEFFSGRRALFEFTEKDDADIGYILAAPEIIKLQTNQGDSNGEYFLAFANGYNSSNSQGDTFLFLLSLNKNFNTSWTLNKDYFKLKIPPLNQFSPTALTAPGLVVDMVGNTNYAYSGDLQGRIWRFDFTKKENPDSVKPVNIFNAVDSKQATQPITAAPVISYTPDDGYLVLFGTGKYIETADTNPATFQTHSFYAIEDNKAAAKSSYFVSDRGKLARRTLSNGHTAVKNGFTVAGDDFVYGNASSTKTMRGWYVDFPSGELTGERSISTSLIANGDVYFNTITPTRSGSPQSHSYVLNLLTGKTSAPEILTGRDANIGLSGVPILILNKTERGTQDAIGQRQNTQYFSIMNFGSNNAAKPSVSIESIKTVQRAGRLSWREIQNWQDLKN